MRKPAGSWKTTLTALGLKRAPRKSGKLQPRRTRRHFEQLESRYVLNGSPIEVSTLDDGPIDHSDDETHLTLREALALTQSANGPTEISIPDGLGLTVALDPAEGQLSINSDVSIVGPGADSLSVVADESHRVFNIASGFTVSIEGVTITGGGNVDRGGGIFNSGDLTLDGVVVSGNTTNFTATSGANNGGGIYSDNGSLEIYASTIRDNQAKYGGGIYAKFNDASDKLIVDGSTISFNRGSNTGGDGSGGVGLGGGITVDSSSAAAQLAFVNATISGNLAGSGGGVQLQGASNATFTNVTIAYNTADGDNNQNSGMGLGGGVNGVGSSLATINNSIVALNTHTHSADWDDLTNFSTEDWAGSHNVFGDLGRSRIPTTETTNLEVGTGNNPGILPLGEYGGLTSTHAIAANSVAIDHGDYQLAVGADGTELLNDQRGIDHRRQHGQSVDAGAAEANVVQQPQGDVTVYGTDAADFLLVNQAPYAATVSGLDMQPSTVYLNGVFYTVPASMAALEVYGNDGNDRISVKSYSQGALIDGGEGEDELTGGTGVDQLVGGGELDRLYSGSGDTPEPAGSAVILEAVAMPGDPVEIRVDNASGSSVTWQVDWGNGQVDTLTTSNPSHTFSHPYAVGGKFTIRVWQVLSDGDLVSIPIPSGDQVTAYSQQLSPPIDVKKHDSDSTKIKWDVTTLDVPGFTRGAKIQASLNGIDWYDTSANNYQVVNDYGLGGYEKTMYFRVATVLTEDNTGIKSYSEYSAPFRRDDAQEDSAVPVEAHVLGGGSHPRISLTFSDEAELRDNADVTLYKISRRAQGDSNWTLVADNVPYKRLAKNGSQAWIDRDPSLEGNQVYEYRVERFQGASADATGYSVVATRLSEDLQEDRGDIVLVIDDRFESSLAFEIARLKQDLEGDGWRVIPLVKNVYADVAEAGVPNADAPGGVAFKRSQQLAEEIRAEIKTLWEDTSNNVRSVLLLGHIPVPASGWDAPDGHSENEGSLPADAFYGDMDGVWTDNTTFTPSDSTVRPTKVPLTLAYNVPNDGIYDQVVLPPDPPGGDGERLELSVGRVDMFGMPAFDPESQYTEDPGEYQSYAISVGQHYTGLFDYFAVSFGNERAEAASDAVGKLRNITLQNGADTLILDPSQLTISRSREAGGRARFGGSDNPGTYDPASDELELQGNNWLVASPTEFAAGSTDNSVQYSNGQFVIDENTVLTFEYQAGSSTQPDALPQIAAVGFDIEDTPSGSKEFVREELQFRISAEVTEDLFGSRKSASWGVAVNHQSELGLLRQYLDKDHAYRQGNMTVDSRAFIGAAAGNKNSLFQSMYSLFGESNVDVVGKTSSNAPGLDVTKWALDQVNNNSYKWATFLGGSGNFWTFGGTVHTMQYVEAEYHAVFNNTRSSYNVNWDRADNVQRAIIANSGEGLVSIWGDGIIPYVMGAGGTIGDTLLDSYNRLPEFNAAGRGTDGGESEVQINLLGDPTLRLHVVSPAADVTLSTTTQGVDVAWSASADQSVDAYKVYSREGSSGAYAEVGTVDAGDSLVFSDSAGTASTEYMVRARKLEVTPSGSYYNLSQGAFSTGVRLVASLNVGGNSVSSPGFTFAGDDVVVPPYFGAGDEFDLSDPSITIMATASVFQTADLGAIKTYTVGLAPGQYAVRLYFAEVDNAVDEAGERVFDVKIQDEVKLDDYDIFADVGADTAVAKTFIVTVDSSGVLEINLDGEGTDEALLSAFEVFGL